MKDLRDELLLSRLKEGGVGREEPSWLKEQPSDCPRQEIKISLKLKGNKEQDTRGMDINPNIPR